MPVMASIPQTPVSIESEKALLGSLIIDSQSWEKISNIITPNDFYDLRNKDIFSEIRADAGVGFTYTFDKFGPIEAVNPLIIRFDIPFFLNRPPASDKDFVQMRWIIGINRAF